MKPWESKYIKYPLYLWANTEEWNEDKTNWNDLKNEADKAADYAKSLEETILEIDSIDELEKLKKDIIAYKENTW